MLFIKAFYGSKFFIKDIRIWNFHQHNTYFTFTVLMRIELSLNWKGKKLNVMISNIRTTLLD